MKNAHKKAIIIGGGPAGLTAAYELQKRGINVTVLESENILGGISRTVQYKGFRFDIGGHRFFTKNTEVEKWWNDMLGKDFLSRPRISRWYYRKKFFDYPIKPLEMLNVFGPIDSVKIFLSYTKARLFPIVPEKTLADWCVNNFGAYLAKPFFIDYNLKLWGVPATELSKDFASQRVKGISLSSALIEALKKMAGIKDTKIKSLIEEFKYPKYGPGQMWEKTAEAIEKNGGKVLLNNKVIRLNHKNGKIASLIAKTPSGEKKFSADYFISTMPLKELILSLNPLPPVEVREAAEKLMFRDFITVALMINQKIPIKDTWIYTHDEGMKPIRIQMFNNWSPYMVPNPNQSCIGFEYVCTEGDSLWKMSEKQLIDQAKNDLNRLNFADIKKVFDAKVIKLKNVYPAYLLDYKANIDKIKNYINSNFKDYSLQPIGRGGLHRYNNSDHSMMTSFLAVKNILGEGKFDQWNVNSDAEYHEEKKHGSDKKI